MRPALAALLILVGCGSAASGGLADDAAVTDSPWVVLDLASGTVTPASGTVDPADGSWSGDLVLFRVLPPGEAVVGRAVADSAAEADEHPQRRVQTDRLWIAAHELSQRQWLRLAGSRPWLMALPVTDPSPWLGDGLPAFGLSPRLAEAALARPLANGWLLDLPDSDEWERACLAGGSGKYAWGDDPDLAPAHAVCASLLPQAVGGRQGNAWGLHDVHGNVWELVRDGGGWLVRGGGWDQPVVTARASNRLQVGIDCLGWNVGLRPVLRR